MKRIVISHFHPDHIAGLKDFPAAEFIASRTAWEAVRNRKGLRALLCGFLPGLLPDDFEQRLHLVESFSDPGLGSLERACDLFGDQSVRLFELPGHATGQIGALVQTDSGAKEFLVADSAWTSSAIVDQTMPHWVTRIFIGSFADTRCTLEKLNLLSHQFPDVRLIPTHCPAIAQAFGFDAQTNLSVDEPTDLPKGE